MSNRHERRASVAAFRRNVGRYLDTALVPAGTNLDGYPVLRDALVYWEAQRQVHSRQCIACMTEFDADGSTVGAFLFATAPSMPGSASISAFCRKCVQELPATRVEECCVRMLKKLLPSGRFEPLSP
jgi:hypothetical protein